MRKIAVIISIFSLLITLYGCKDKEFLNFKLNYETEFTIPKTNPEEGQHDLSTPEVETSSKEKFKNHKTRPYLVRDVRLTDLGLTINNPNKETFSFLEKIIIYIKAEGLPKKEIGRREKIPEDIGDHLLIIKSGEKLDPYLKKEKFSIDAKVKVDKPVPKDTDVLTEITFGVEAEPL